MYRDNLNFVFVTILCGVVLSEGQLTRPVLRVPNIHKSCEPITEVDICANVGYNKTTFPNYRNQESQQEARNEILQFFPLIQAGCSTALVHLLCAVYVPFCADFFDGQMRIPPCRELCEYVRGGCESMLVKSGFVWPPHLNCSLYPFKGTLCFGPDDLTNLQPPENVSIPAPQGLLPSVEVTVLGPTVVLFSWEPPASSQQEVNGSYNSTLLCHTKLNQTHNQMVLTQEYNSDDMGTTDVQLDGFLPSTTYTCNVTIFSTAASELSVQASTNFTTPSPLEVQFIINTPVVQGANIHAVFKISRPAMQVTCNLIPAASGKVNCSNGSVTFSNINPGEYVVRVVARNSKHDEVALRRKVVVTGGSSLCGSHLINRGITQTGRNVTIEFTGTGPRTGFTCRLDKKKSYSCSSPVVLAGLEAGGHVLKITPNGCKKSTKAKFNV